MAQKQFKIGLSNTDKQNMAQDVYERLLALTFPEYDTTTEYEVGDFVVYNDQLYKCIGATSGAWDSTKWQLATLNDLLTDIENAVAFVNDKANVNGNYPTMTVGFADNLTPYDESAGDDQDEPFIFQATGTGNGTQPDFSTGSGALMKEKQGNTVVVNQWLKNPTFESTSYWSPYNATRSVSNNILSFTANARSGGVNQTSIKIPSGHKLFVKADIKLTTATDKVYVDCRLNSRFASATTNWQTVVYICDAQPADSGNIFFEVNDSRDSDWDEVQVKNVSLIDLTQWFNGDIPQDLLDNPSNFFRYYQGSLAYNEGELVNANGRYIKCIGMNQWDEETELGSYDTLTGEKIDNSSKIRNKNPISVIPNTQYVKYSSNNGVYWLVFYDANMNYIERQGINFGSNTFTTPSNACYMNMLFESAYGTTYKNDISINLYYEDEPRCLTYEPYQVLTNNDTGNEVLRSAGSGSGKKVDYKLPSGEIHRLVGEKVFDGTETINVQSAELCIYRYYVGDPMAEQIHSAATFPLYEEDKTHSIGAGMKDKSIITYNSTVYFRDTSCASASELLAKITGKKLFYELAEPTTEQGTSYSENLVIDDFGSMDFGSDVPQGALIFYPVDYKAFVDTLYKYTDGTPSNIALKSDVASEQSARESVDSQLKEALGGTLRNILALDNSVDFLNTDFVDLGSDTLSYAKTTYGTTTGFYTQSLASVVKSSSKCVCTKFVYQDNDSTFNNNNVDLEITISSIGWIKIKCSAYTDATAFKNAMKGVLLAYEKASE